MKIKRYLGEVREVGLGRIMHSVGFRSAKIKLAVRYLWRGAMPVPDLAAAASQPEASAGTGSALEGR